MVMEALELKSGGLSAVAMRMTSAEAEFQALDKAVGALVMAVEQRARTQADGAIARADRAPAQTLALLVGALALSLLAIVACVRMINRPLSQAVRMAQQVAEGDLSTARPTSHRTEETARSLQGTAQTVDQLASQTASNSTSAAQACRLTSSAADVYKRSWRANDWTWGRLDGIDRAVRIALNPDALQRRFAVRASGGRARAPVVDEVRRYLKAVAVDGAAPALRGTLSDGWEADAEGIARELQWLDEPATVPPPVLELCARALTRRRQLETLCRELPEIAASLRQEAGLGAQPAADPIHALLARVPPGTPPDPQHAIDLVRRGLLGAETLAMQVGTDHFTRLATRGLATTQAALASRHGGLGSLTVVVRLIEWPLRVLHWLGGRLAQDSSTTAALEAMSLGVGGTLVVAAGVSEKMPDALVAFGWALLAGSVGVSLLRSVAWGGLLASAVAVLLAVTHKVSAGAMVAVVVGMLLLRWRATAPLVAAAAVLAAAWWSTGARVDAAILWWQRTLAPGPAPVRPDKPEAAVQALWQATDRLDSVPSPALTLAVLILLGAWSRPLGRVLRRWRKR